MKKVLIFSLAYLPSHVGGAEIAIKEKTDRMPDIEFHLIANRYDSELPAQEKIGNVIVHRIGITRKKPAMADLRTFPLHLNKFLYQFLAPYHAHRLHREHSFAAVWSMMAHSTGVPGALFKMAYPAVPFVLELQEGDPPEKIERTMLPLWPLFTRAFTSADVVTVISTFLGGWARRRGYVKEIVLVPNAIDGARFSKEFSQDEIARAKEKLRKKPGDIFLVTTSRLVTKNAVDDIMRALPELSEQIHLVVYGTGPDEVMLKKLTEELSLQSRVHFLGHISQDDLPLALKACDIFVRPSRSEGMGISFIEAMAAGIPVIATQEGGISDFLFDAAWNPDKTTTGWAVKKDSPGQIARAVKDILADPVATAQVVAQAKEMALHKYEWTAIAKDMREKVFGAVGV